MQKCAHTQLFYYGAYRLFLKVSHLCVTSSSANQFYSYPHHHAVGSFTYFYTFLEQIYRRNNLLLKNNRNRGRDNSLALILNMFATDTTLFFWLVCKTRQMDVTSIANALKVFKLPLEHK